VISVMEQIIAKALASISLSEITRNSYTGFEVRVNGINSTEKPKPIKPLQPIIVPIPVSPPSTQLITK
jgi:hypothetical protein